MYSVAKAERCDAKALPSMAEADRCNAWVRRGVALVMHSLEVLSVGKAGYSSGKAKCSIGIDLLSAGGAGRGVAKLGRGEVTRR